jgi:hypothetical protein
MKLRERPFRPDDAVPVLGDLPVPHGDGVSLVDEHDRALAFGVIADVDGALWAFVNILDEAARRPVMLHRRVLLALAAVDQPVFTLLDARKPRAQAWLERLGFRPLPDTDKTHEILITEQQLGVSIWRRL